MALPHRISNPQISWWPSIIPDGTECGGKRVVTIVENVESKFAESMRTLNWLWSLYRISLSLLLPHLFSVYLTVAGFQGQLLTTFFSVAMVELPALTLAGICLDVQIRICMYESLIEFFFWYINKLFTSTVWMWIWEDAGGRFWQFTKNY